MRKIIADADFDGICCSVLLKKLYPEAKIILATPQTIGQIETTEEDIIADLPAPKGFKGTRYDHHKTEKIPRGVSKKTSSCAKLLLSVFPKLKPYKDIVMAADRIDSGKFTKEMNTPEEQISYSLNTGNGDKQHKQRIIKMLLAGQTLQQIANNPLVTVRIEHKMAQVKKTIEALPSSTKKIYNTTFTTITGQTYPSIIKEYYKTGTNYIITIKGELITISRNPYKQGINLLQLTKPLGAQGKPHKVYFKGDIQKMQLIMEQIAIAEEEK